MDIQKRNKLIEQFKCPKDEWEQMDAAYELASSTDAEVTTALLLALEQLEDYYSEYTIDPIIDGLMEVTSTSLPIVIAYLKHSPFSQAGKECAYILGEIAYRQGNNQDPRTVPSLLQVGSIALSMDRANALTGSDAFSIIIHALRECARSGPIPEAQELMQAALTIAQGMGEKLYTMPVLDILEVMYINNRDNLLSKLNMLLEAEDLRHDFAETVREFLAEHNLSIL